MLLFQQTNAQVFIDNASPKNAQTVSSSQDPKASTQELELKLKNNLQSKQLLPAYENLRLLVMRSNNKEQLQEYEQLYRKLTVELLKILPQGKTYLATTLNEWKWFLEFTVTDNSTSFYQQVLALNEQNSTTAAENVPLLLDTLDALYEQAEQWNICLEIEQYYQQLLIANEASLAEMQTIQNRIAITLFNLERYEAALNQHKQLLASYQQSNQSAHNIALTQYYISQCYFKLQQFPEAWFKILKGFQALNQISLTVLQSDIGKALFHRYMHYVNELHPKIGISREQSLLGFEIIEQAAPKDVPLLYSWVLLNIGNAHGYYMRFAEAQTAYDKALLQLEGLPTTVHKQQIQALTLLALGKLGSHYKPMQARSRLCLNELLTLATKSKNPQWEADAYKALGVLESTENNFKAAIKAYEAAISLQKEDTLYVLECYAQMLYTFGTSVSPDTLKKYRSRFNTLAQKHYIAEDLKPITFALFDNAEHLLKKGSYHQASEAFNFSYRLGLIAFGETSLFTATNLQKLGESALALQQFSKAENCLIRSDMVLSMLPRESTEPNRIVSHFFWIRFYIQLNDAGKAQEQLDQLTQYPSKAWEAPTLGDQYMRSWMAVIKSYMNNQLFADAFNCYMQHTLHIQSLDSLQRFSVATHNVFDAIAKAIKTTSEFSKQFQTLLEFIANPDQSTSINDRFAFELMTLFKALMHAEASAAEISTLDRIIKTNDSSISGYAQAILLTVRAFLEEKSFYMDQAIASYQIALDAIENLSTQNTGFTYQLYTHYLELLIRTDRTTQAQALAKKFLEFVSLHMTSEQSVELCLAYYAIARAQGSRNLDSAINYLKKGVAIAQALNKPQYSANGSQKMGDVYFAQGKLADAIQYYRAALEEAEGLELQDIIHKTESLTQALILNNQLTEAEVILIQLLQSVEQQSELDIMHHASLHALLARIYLFKNQQDVSLEHARKAYQLMDKTVDLDHPDRLARVHQMASIYFYFQDVERASQLFKNIVTQMERTERTEYATYLSAVYNLASIQEQLGKLETAEPLYQTTVDATINRFGPNHSKTATAMLDLGRLLLKLKKHNEAENYLLQSWKIHQDKNTTDNDEAIKLLNQLVTLYQVNEQHETAAQYLTHLYTLAPQQNTHSIDALAAMEASELLAETVLRNEYERNIATHETNETLSDHTHFLKNYLATYTAQGNNSPALWPAISLDKQAAVHALKNIVAHSDILVNSQPPQTLKDLQRALPLNTACLKFIQYVQPETKQSRYGVVLINQQSTYWIDLGSSDKMDAAVFHAKLAMRLSKQAHDDASKNRLQNDVYKKWSTLSELLWLPIAIALTPSTDTLYINAVSNLTFIPFSTLISADDTYVGESKKIIYLHDLHSVIHLREQSSNHSISQSEGSPLDTFFWEKEKTKNTAFADQIPNVFKHSNAQLVTFNFWPLDKETTSQPLNISQDPINMFYQKQKDELQKARLKQGMSIRAAGANALGIAIE